MSYICMYHGWQHVFDPCPKCSQAYTTSNTAIIDNQREWLLANETGRAYTDAIARVEAAEKELDKLKNTIKKLHLELINMRSWQLDGPLDKMIGYFIEEISKVLEEK